MTLDELLGMGGAELDRAMRAGHPIDVEALVGREYEGVSLNLPRWQERLAWKKFIKTFHRDPGSDAVRGWNVRVVQTPLDAPWEHATRRGAPITFGHFGVVPAAGRRIGRPYDQGLMIDYGLGANAALDPIRRMRDPVVAVNEGSAELLLGWSYFDLGVLVPTWWYFALRRGAPLDHVA